jgi:DNA uptake protein ComE-like DNA-binding protein
MSSSKNAVSYSTEWCSSMPFLDWFANLAQSQSLRSRILNDPYYRFQSLEEIEIAASLGIRIDANQAGVDDWLRLPGLSIHQARTLVDLTQTGVYFHSLEDVAAVLNQPPHRLKPWEPILQFCHYEEDSVYTIQPINANTASVTALTRIPDVDLYLAKAIVQNRPYRNLPHLQQQLSLSKELTAKLMHYLKF